MSNNRPHSAVAGDDAQGQRLDVWLSGHDPELSRTRVRRLIDAGLVNVDGRLRPASHRLKGGEEIEWERPVAEETGLEPDPSVQFGIVHEDEHLAVIEKPAGLVVHPAPGHRAGTLVHGLLARLDSLSDVGGRARPGLVHRLDKDTSGLLVVAKNDAAHASLAAQLKDRSLGREYVALCWGRFRDDERQLDFPLDRHPRERKRRAVVEGGREARTDLSVLRRLAGATELRLRLHTGRTHQIRVHLAHVGHPVLGDELYGGGSARLGGASPAHRGPLRRALAALGRQALHAATLRLVHPASGETMRFDSALPPEMRAAIEHLLPAAE